MTRGGCQVWWTRDLGEAELFDEGWRAATWAKAQDAQLRKVTVRTVKTIALQGDLIPPDDYPVKVPDDFY
jgi:hypothetical protein